MPTPEQVLAKRGIDPKTGEQDGMLTSGDIDILTLVHAIVKQVRAPKP
jgi:hypothetical protein